MGRPSTIGDLLGALRCGVLDPVEVVEHAHACAVATPQPAWLALRPLDDLRAQAAALRDRSLPLFGLPFAVKDNIDVAGLPTTAACPAYGGVAPRHATVVERLVAAGAIPLGKTNMDQFATGLAGTRTPHGACWSVADDRYVSGGSSSGSAVVVADGTVPFALGTDTAGSGRVPAACNGIVGLKPSRGLVSTHGVLPACRTLDCVSVFTADLDGAARVLDVAAGPDARDPFSRVLAQEPARPGPAVLAVPEDAQTTFTGDAIARDAWRDAIDAARAAGHRTVAIDFAPFAAAARLLYEGPWVAERYAAVGSFVAARPDAVDPVVARIVLGGREASAVDAFRGAYELAALRAAATAALGGADALLVPTIPTHPTIAAVAADPVARVAELGTYTNFANLLDLCGVALPLGERRDGLPFGATLLAPAGADARLLALGAEIRAATTALAPLRRAGR